VWTVHLWDPVLSLRKAAVAPTDEATAVEELRLLSQRELGDSDYAL
jgi:hypothetical protein